MLNKFTFFPMSRFPASAVYNPESDTLDVTGPEGRRNISLLITTINPYKLKKTSGFVHFFKPRAFYMTIANAKITEAAAS